MRAGLKKFQKIMDLSKLFVEQADQEMVADPIYDPIYLTPFISDFWSTHPHNERCFVISCVAYYTQTPCWTFREVFMPKGQGGGTFFDGQYGVYFDWRSAEEQKAMPIDKIFLDQAFNDESHVLAQQCVQDFFAIFGNKWFN